MPLVETRRPPYGSPLTPRVLLIRRSKTPGRAPPCRLMGRVAEMSAPKPWHVGAATAVGGRVRITPSAAGQQLPPGPTTDRRAVITSEPTKISVKTPTTTVTCQGLPEIVDPACARPQLLPVGRRGPAA